MSGAGLVVECIVAIDATRVRFPGTASLFIVLELLLFIYFFIVLSIFPLTCKFRHHVFITIVSLTLSVCQLLFTRTKKSSSYDNALSS